jgi:hypothetical protein
MVSFEGVCVLEWGLLLHPERNMCCGEREYGYPILQFAKHKNKQPPQTPILFWPSNILAMVVIS